MPAETDVRNNDAVIAVDVQNDFCPGGALPVREGDKVVPVLNKWLAAAESAGALTIASRDWHTVSHCSFSEQGGPWPEHCVQGTAGAEFHPDLKLPRGTVLVSKGTAFDRDAYSAFDGTGLRAYLQNKGIKRLWIGGLALDVCVRETVRDACKYGFEPHLLVAASRAVDPEKAECVLDELRELGAVIEDSS